MTLILGSGHRFATSKTPLVQSTETVREISIFVRTCPTAYPLHIPPWLPILCRVWASPSFYRKPLERLLKLCIKELTSG